MNTYKITMTQIKAYNSKTDLITIKTVQAKSAIAALWESGHIASRYTVDNNKKVENAYVAWANGTRTALAEKI